MSEADMSLEHATQIIGQCVAVALANGDAWIDDLELGTAIKFQRHSALDVALARVIEDQEEATDLWG